MTGLPPVVALVLVLASCAAPTATAPKQSPVSTAIPRIAGGPDITLATTTSTQDSGLLDTLIPLFQRQTGYRVKTISVGTGAALALGVRGEVDVVLVHAPEAEERWMAEGNGTARLLVMHNDFVIVGPPSDPAGINGGRSAMRALTKIADRQAVWVSRDDDSGTDQIEKRLWRDAGLSPKGQGWYIASGQGMGPTLTMADQKGAYTLTDRATYLARKGSLQSVLLVEGDPRLFNVYHVMPVNPAKFPRVKLNVEGGKAFADFLVSPVAQQAIGDFGRSQYGQPLFVADAGRSEAELSQ